MDIVCLLHIMTSIVLRTIQQWIGSRGLGGRVKGDRSTKTLLHTALDCSQESVRRK